MNVSDLIINPCGFVLNLCSLFLNLICIDFRWKIFLNDFSCKKKILFVRKINANPKINKFVFQNLRIQGIRLVNLAGAFIFSENLTYVQTQKKHWGGLR